MGTTSPQLDSIILQSLCSIQPTACLLLVLSDICMCVSPSQLDSSLTEQRLSSLHPQDANSSGLEIAYMYVIYTFNEWTLLRTPCSFHHNYQLPGCSRMFHQKLIQKAKYIIWCLPKKNNKSIRSHLKSYKSYANLNGFRLN